MQIVSFQCRSSGLDAPGVRKPMSGRHQKPWKDGTAKPKAQPWEQGPDLA
jgi:hypothetical protein